MKQAGELKCLTGVYTGHSLATGLRFNPSQAGGMQNFCSFHCVLGHSFFTNTHFIN